MIGLTLLAIIIGYIILSALIIFTVYKITRNKKKMMIALTVMVLIPTWDVILGFPIYWYLCTFESGMKVYKTVDNVEGFYVGEDHGRYSNIPPLPYDGYRFIEYKKRKKQNEPYKYYRVSWVDANTTKECIQIGAGSSEYNLNLYKQGKCIVKKEISENELSRWWYGMESYWKKVYEIPVVNLKHVYGIKIIDSSTKEVMSEVVDYWWKGGWLFGLVSSIEIGSPTGIECVFSGFTINDYQKRLLSKTMKLEGHDNDNNN